MSEILPIAAHEGGHVVVGLDRGAVITSVTIEPGEVSDGCTNLIWPPAVAPPVPAVDTPPFACWDPAAKNRAEGELISVLAGDIARELLAPRPTSSRGVDTVVEAAIEMVVLTLPPTRPEVIEEAAASVDTPGDTDAQRAAKLAQWCHQGDPQSAAAWLAFCAAQARALVVAQAAKIRLVASYLGTLGTLGPEALAFLLSGDEP